MTSKLKNIVFFAGKGGVGKTTSSVTYAIKCAENGDKTLVTSTDPAHSISHLIETRVGDKITKIDERLFAREIDLQKESENHRNRIMNEIRQVISPDKVSSVKKYLKMTHNSPGVRESAMLDSIIDTIEEMEHDKLVFDTAPTGQTLRLLKLPELLDGWVNRLMDRRKRDLKKLKNSDATEVPGKSLIGKLKERRDRLRYSRKKIVEESSLIPVLTPQKLSLEETKEGIKVLEEINIDIPGVIINKVSQQNKERKKYEEKRIKEIKNELNKEILGKIPRSSTEVLGLDNLKNLTKYINHY